MAMDPQDLGEYLHRQIPLSAAMQVDVRSATAQSVVLSAPLAPNINHKRSEEHTSELQSLMRISYAVFCWKKKKNEDETQNQLASTQNATLPNLLSAHIFTPT